MISYFEELQQTLELYVGAGLSPYLIATLIISSSFLLAEIVNLVFSKILVKLAVRTKTETDDHIIKLLEPAIFYSVFLLGFYQSLLFIKFLDGYAIYFSDLIKSLTVLIWASAISKIIQIIIGFLGSRVAAKSKYSLDTEMVPLFKNISSLIVWFVGAAILLKVWNLNITPLLASAGIVGLAVAFAAQDTIAHLFGGISIYFDKPFRAGDRIQLDSGEIGDVLEIGIRSTKIKTFDETVIIIPNSIIASSKIVNYNKPKSKIKVKIDVSLAYGTDVKKAKKAILDVLQNAEDVETDPAPSVYLTDMGDFALRFLAIVWVANPKKQFEIRTSLTEKLYTMILKEKFVIPYPTQEIRVKK
ncbi:MAG: mechanosensitive ion channel family protein [Candidatus Pacebacteria bacterium]|nr:mechanosensitive ion channel family protein [Candidatus Paceibacterota bacterium]